MQSFGAALFYYGDNINDIMESYGEDLGCKEDCLRNNRIAAIITLGGAFIILQFGPQILVCIRENEHQETIWYSALDMIVIITSSKLLQL